MIHLFGSRPAFTPATDMKKILFHILLFTLLVTESAWILAQPDTPVVPGSPQAKTEAMRLFQHAETLRKSNHFPGAMVEFDKALLYDPTNTRILFSRASCLMQLKDWSAAVIGFEEVIRQKADHVPAYTNIARCYQEMGRTVKVVDYLDMAFKYDTDEKRRMEYKFNVVELLMEQKAYDLAIRHIAEGKLIDPHSAQLAYHEAVIHNAKGNHRQAVNTLLPVVSNLPEDPKISARYFYELGLAYNRLQEYEQSFNAFRKANHGPFKPLVAKFSPSYYVNSAVGYLKILDYETSKRMLQIAVKIQANYAHAYLMLSNISRREADQTEAIGLLRRAAQIEQDEKKLAVIYDNLAQVLYDNAKYPDAVRACDEHLRRNPNNYQILFLKGMAYYRQQNFTSAISVLDEAAAIPGLDAETKAQFLFALGVVSRDHGDIEKAKTAFKKSAFGPFTTVAQVEYEQLVEHDKKAVATTAP